MLLAATKVSTETMTYSPEQNVLCAEASTLGLRPGQTFDRLYDDAIDVGLIVRSHRTGRETPYALARTEPDREGDTTHWELVPVERRDHDLPRLLIFND